MTNSFPWRMSIIRAVQFAGVMAIVLWPVGGWAQNDGAATFTPFEVQKAWLGISDRKVDARSAPAKVASESEGNLNLNGYFEIGTIRASHPGTKEDPDITKQMESAILRKAAEAGGDIVQFNLEGAVGDFEMPTGKMRKIPGMCLQGGNQVVSTSTTTHSCTTDVHGFTNCSNTTTPGYGTAPTCLKWGPPVEVPVTRRVKELVSAGTVWRYDPELAPEVARKALAARNAARITLEKTDIEDEHSRITKRFEAAKAAPATEKNFGPLHDALEFEKTDEAELLAQGADVNAKVNDKVGWTPLKIAEKSRHQDIVDLLRQHGGHK